MAAIVCVVSVGKFDDGFVQGRDGIRAASCGRMHENDGLPAIEFVHHRGVLRIAEQLSIFVAGQEPDAVEFQRVQRVFDFAKAPIDVGQRNRGSHSKTAGIILDQLGAVLI
jgi:hypothetical protein